MTIGSFNAYLPPINDPAANSLDSSLKDIPDIISSSMGSGELHAPRPEAGQIVVVDDFQASPGERAHGDETSYVAEQASETGTDNVEEVGVSLSGSDLVHTLSEIASRPDKPIVVNLSLGNNPASILMAKIDDYIARKGELPPKDVLQQFVDSAVAEYGSFAAEDKSLREAIAKLVEQGVTVVIAAGNEGEIFHLLEQSGVMVPPGFDDNAFYDGNMPEGVIVVGASESNRPSAPAAPFTTPSEDVDVAADGTQVDVGGGDKADGTSFAAPAVAGLVADMKATTPDLTPAQIERILKQSASGRENDETGSGVVDRDKALYLAAHPDEVESPAAPDGSVISDVFKDVMNPGDSTQKRLSFRIDQS